jgi:hypothetical protein
MGVKEVEFVFYKVVNPADPLLPCTGVNGGEIGRQTDSSTPYDTTFTVGQSTRAGIKNCVETVATAVDVCGRSTDSKPTRVEVTDCVNPLVREAPGTDRLTWTSDLQVPGGTGQVILNGTSSYLPGHGRASAASALVAGENRMEATLVNAAGKPGTWGFELSTDRAVTPGTLRVVAGDVALVSDTAVVFRMRGTPGERVVFTFRKR